MRRVILSIITVLYLMSLIGCSSLKDQAVASAEPVYPDSGSFDDYEAIFDNREKNILDESFINSLKDFEYNSATEILNNSEGNINVFTY